MPRPSGRSSRGKANREKAPQVLAANKRKVPDEREPEETGLAMSLTHEPSLP